MIKFIKGGANDKVKMKLRNKSSQTLQNEITDHNTVVEFSLITQKVKPLRNNELLVLHEIFM